jgi:hypothetical protein
VLIRWNTSALRRTRWYEYASRFLFGGIVTVLAGVIAHRYGPAVGGLFLAFPAIFPASASLIEKHQKEKKQRAGFDGSRRGRVAAGVDAAGAAMGSAGLAVFAFILWKLLPSFPAWAALIVATAAWATTAGLAWFVGRRGIRYPRRLFARWHRTNER